MGILTRRNPLFTEVSKKYSKNPPEEPGDSTAELHVDDLCTDVQLMIERLDSYGETWDQSSGSSRKAEPTEEDHASEANKKIERPQSETNAGCREKGADKGGRKNKNKKERKG